MNPLFDMLANMQKDNRQPSIAKQMASQFGLQRAQAEKAMEALMPAFTQGMKRSAAATPQGFASFMQALAGGNHADYLQNPMKAFSPEGMNEGNAILGHLFGSKEVSRAVAAQAEAASGVSQSILKQMLPVLAPMVMGGMFKQMTGQAQQQTAQAQNAFGGSGGGILGQILQEMMKNGMGGMPQQRAPQPDQARPRARNPLEEILEQMTGGTGFPGGGSRQSGGAPGGSLGDIFNEMLKNGPLGQAGPTGGEGYGDAPQPRYGDPSDDPYGRNDQGGTPDLDDIFGRNTTAENRAPQEDESNPHGYPKGTGLEDLFGDLFKPAKQGMPQYDKAIESIFDQFLPKR